MSLTVKENRNFFSIPERSLIAHCCAVIDLGMMNKEPIIQDFQRPFKCALKFYNSRPKKLICPTV